MSCNCVHCREAIQDGESVIAEMRELFIKRMTVDSETKDARRRDFNQAIFVICDDGSTAQAFNNTDMDMVLRCFDDAAKDWRRSFCDVETCRRPSWHERNREHLRLYNKAYHARSEQKEKDRLYRRRYYLAHTDELREKALARYYADHEENKRKNRERAQARRQAQKEAKR